MKQKRRTRLAVEQLEQRWVPANVKCVGSPVTMYISPSAGESALNVVVKQTAANMFSVTDGGKNDGGCSGVSNILITGGNGADTITIDLNGKVYTGSLTASTGNGADTVTIMSSAVGGAIRGDVTLLGGPGNHVVNLATGANGVAFGGSVQATDTVAGAANTFNLGAAANTSASTIGKNLNITGFNTVSLGGAAGDTVDGSVTVNDGLVSLGAKITLNDKLTINQNLSVTTGAGNDTIAWGSDTVTGNVQINTGAGNDSVSETTGKTAFVGGNLSVTYGSGNDSFAVLGGSGTVLTVGGNLSLSFGDGNDTIALNNNGPPSTNVNVNGNLDITLGGGANSVSEEAVVNGDMHWHLGNGNDTVTIGNAPGGRLFWSSGNGNDSVTFGDGTNSAGETWNVQMQFGTGSDTLTLAGNGTVATPEFLTGFIDMGGPPGGNSFDPTGSLVAGTWVIVEPFTLQNV
jgi:hypothetical protein